MRKWTMDNGQWTIIFTIVAFTFSILNSQFSIPSALALDSTPSADIRAKLEEFKKEIASKAAKLKQEVSNKLKDKAYIGKVKTKSDTTITLATKNGSKLININQDTEFDSNIKNKKYSQKTLAEEDYSTFLGDVDETGVLTAKKVILLPQPKAGQPLAEKTFLWGQIISISDKLLTLKDKNSKSIAVSMNNPSSVKVSNFVILTGSTGKNDIFEAEFVYVIPQGGVLKPKKIATPSAKIASPSAHPLTPERSDGERAKPTSH